MASRRREALRSTLWVVPAVFVVGAVVLWLATQAVDRAVYDGRLTLPSWVESGSADAARQILIAIVAAVITVVGVVFSITIVALTLVSTQFGPRVLRTFIQDLGTQVTLGMFVATFFYAFLTLVSIQGGAHGDFVPHLCLTVTFGLMMIDLLMLIYFIHHVATGIQLPVVVAGIARDFDSAIDAYRRSTASPSADATSPAGGPEAAVLRRIEADGAPVLATESGYVQFINYARLARIAGQEGATIQMLFRPGHFVTAGSPLARVWPPEAAPVLTGALGKVQTTGSQRTLIQDPALAADQLVEIAIRALSPAVNDTFTALNCIDWLTAGLCRAAGGSLRDPVRRDAAGEVRLIEARVRYERLVDRCFDKIRQAGRGNPAVAMRQLDGLARIIERVGRSGHRRAVLHQAEMILRSSDESVPEASDRIAVRERYDAVVAAAERVGVQPGSEPVD